ncbi:hypothetical protein ACQPZP_33310 [Spirillospora sp. CA-142024]|uniref:hypothetical protein n=1 Tax=Spirillospora sp. CA-142024 TaxID=3240036 RepID=UPI003D8EDF31
MLKTATIRAKVAVPAPNRAWSVVEARLTFAVPGKDFDGRSQLPLPRIYFGAADTDRA